MRLAGMWENSSALRVHTGPSVVLPLRPAASSNVHSIFARRCFRVGPARHANARQMNDNKRFRRALRVAPSTIAKARKWNTAFTFGIHRGAVLRSNTLVHPALVKVLAAQSWAMPQASGFRMLEPRSASKSQTQALSGSGLSTSYSGLMAVIPACGTGESTALDLTMESNTCLLHLQRH